jgi:hypothetical protein
MLRRAQLVILKIGGGFVIYHVRKPKVGEGEIKIMINSTETRKKTCH